MRELAPRRHPITYQGMRSKDAESVLKCDVLQRRRDSACIHVVPLYVWCRRAAFSLVGTWCCVAQGCLL